jgi:hypothetical protein
MKLCLPQEKSNIIAKKQPRQSIFARKHPVLSGIIIFRQAMVQNQPPQIRIQYRQETGGCRRGIPVTGGSICA